MYDLVLKNGNVLLPNKSIEKVDIGIKRNKILQIGSISKKMGKIILNIDNLIAIPGVIDTQVHFREPGLTHKEDILHGTMGAVLGGVTTIFEMPNTLPPTIDKKSLNFKLSVAKQSSHCNYSFFIGASTKKISSLRKLENLEGCCGVKIFVGSSTGDLLVKDDTNIEKILRVAKRPVAIHSEDEYRLDIRKEIFAKKNISVFDHPKIRDELVAINSTNRLLKIAKKLKRRIHILHISTADEIEIIKRFKNHATCEVTPQHLFFSSPSCYKKLGTLAQMNPPIRNTNHRKGLWKGLKDRVVDVIGSDHAPHTIKEKNKPYPNSPSGMSGVQTLLPIMLDFVNKKKLTISHLSELVSENPCKIYNVSNKGFIKKGYDADITIIDLNKNFKITNRWIASKCKWTPYNDYIVKGMPIHTIVSGKIAMKNNKIVKSINGKEVKFNNSFSQN